MPEKCLAFYLKKVKSIIRTKIWVVFLQCCLERVIWPTEAWVLFLQHGCFCNRDGCIVSLYFVVISYSDMNKSTCTEFKLAKHPSEYFTSH